MIETAYAVRTQELKPRLFSHVLHFPTSHRTMAFCKVLRPKMFVGTSQTSPIENLRSHLEVFADSDATFLDIVDLLRQSLKYFCTTSR